MAAKLVPFSEEDHAHGFVWMSFVIESPRSAVATISNKLDNLSGRTKLKIVMHCISSLVNPVACVKNLFPKQWQCEEIFSESVRKQFFFVNLFQRHP